MSTTPTSKEYRGSKHPRYALRKQEFHQLSDIQHKLDKLYKITEFDNDALEKISIVRGSSFNIDDDDPIDLDPRFFLPGPIENMEYGVDVLDKTEGLCRRRWPQLEPIKNHQIRKETQRLADPEVHPNQRYNYLRATYEANMREAALLAVFCQEAAKVESSWATHGYIHGRKAPCSERIWFSTDNDQPFRDFWTSGEYYRWKRGAGTFDCHNPNVPHAVATVYDSSRPLHQGMLRSELRVAVGLLREQIRRTRVYVDHYIYPVLVVSFHGRFSARITQAYFQNAKVVVRPSRLIDLHTPVMSTDVGLVIRWLNSRAVGETRLPIPEAEQFDDPVPTEVEVSDVKGMSNKTIDVR
ncbi:uncharacterized protein NECHADRAFT_87757 [Fusarium vanettenii 77-13-4]|uniref:Uncharacterized protein n=1 Tax=Fusarium vanettenii (strain ATCC MYA-4622 / CBS 123669 / FGSC 9596 / NRRL 45880 / 77-13-4) TaxID=660122 RepID=C7Z2Y2_FUSV7|nr:uncharacterized protein NECHADRAFT_87757 [Fusarium vanettenii 77-13-4]EEU41736.1 hypothetical protein NECHADRAFT_87757 [Fusarium vanettenii 77-13-4]